MTPRPFPLRTSRAAGAAAVLALAVAACSSPTASPSDPSDPSELDFDEYEQVIEQVTTALESAGVIAPGSIEYGERGAQYENNRCRLFADDASAATVQTQPTPDEVLTVADPELTDSGFGSLEQEEAQGGHLKLVSSDDNGARLEILWKASTIVVTIEVEADLDEASCTLDATA